MYIFLGTYRPVGIVTCTQRLFRVCVVHAPACVLCARVNRAWDFVLAWWYMIQYPGSLMVITLRNVTSLRERESRSVSDIHHFVPVVVGGRY